MATQATNKTIKSLYKREFNPQETMVVLRHRSTIAKFWCWGATGFTNYENKALCFKVSANHHKGYVCISLNWDDTYVIDLISTKGVIKKTINEVYFDMLVDTIDEAIEKIAAYKF